MTRPISLTTPLGPDVLLLVGYTGTEGISQLFHFQLDIVAERKKEVPFDKVLGQGLLIQLALADGKARYFAGICKRISQGDSDGTFTKYRMEMVPHLWLLTKRFQSRIFQHITVPDILKKVLQGLDVTYEIQGAFQPRDYCVQYRESDFNFASRLMEEEGIYYFFKHTDSGHKLVVANTPSSHPDMPGHAAITFEAMTAGNQLEDRVFTWEKAQELRSGKVTLWDHCFELPHKHLETDQMIQESVAAGKVTHKLKVAGNDKLEIYDYPGEYAQRFDGVDKGGGEQPAELQKIFQDNKRAANLRMQQEAAQSLTIQGTSTCRHLVSGHKFNLEKHFNGDGAYVVTQISHTARTMDYRSTDGEFRYGNSFDCIPLAVPFRPQRLTPKPKVHGTQTAVVVGAVGPEEIWCDKYGRVKVQFHWDREGKYDADSSCWIRVATAWAGKGWGQINIPRIGHEVIVDFLEGDPDSPIIMGSVYNAENMPAQKLPAGRKVAGLVSRTNKPSPGFNAITCDDSKGKEQVLIHAQFNMDTTVENDQTTTVHNNRTDAIDVDDKETVGSNQTISIGSNQDITVGAKQDTKVGANQTLAVAADQKASISGNQKLTVGGDQTESISGARSITIGAKDDLTVGGAQTIGVTGAIKITSGASITLEVGGSSIKIGPGAIDIVSSGPITITGAIVKVNS